MDFLTMLREQGAGSLAIFGDSISVGLNATMPDRSWPYLLARRAGIKNLRNHAIAGTMLQSSPLAHGNPRPDNGLSRWRVLVSPQPAHALAILYGYNDARYVAAPHSVNVDAFSRDYRSLLEDLLATGYRDRIVLGSPPYIPDAGLALGTPGFAGQTRQGFLAHVAAVKTLATDFSLFYAPVYEATAAHPDGDLASADIVHPNDAGHAIIAEAFAAARKA